MRLLKLISVGMLSLFLLLSFISNPGFQGQINLGFIQGQIILINPILRLYQFYLLLKPAEGGAEILPEEKSDVDKEMDAHNERSKKPPWPRNQVDNIKPKC